jgi:hypothetical protein
VFTPVGHPRALTYYVCSDSEQHLWERRLDCVVANLSQLLPRTQAGDEGSLPSPVPSPATVIAEFVSSVFHSSALQSQTSIRTMKPQFVNDLLACVMPADWRGKCIEWDVAASPVTPEWFKRLWQYLASCDSLKPVKDAGWPVIAAFSPGSHSRSLLPLSESSSVIISRPILPECNDILKLVIRFLLRLRV